MKFLILGSGGLMGRHICEELKSSPHNYVAYQHADLDICNEAQSIIILEKEQPDVVINTAALCNFSECEKNPAISRAVNLDAPRRWSDFCAERHIRLVLFSSDYIFDGSQRIPYGEDGVGHPLSVYGRHKHLLETSLRHVPTNLIFRPSWIFGLGGKTFMSMMPRLLCENEEIEVASGKRGSCLHAANGAKSIIRIIEAGRNGLWNLVHPEGTSWEEFLDECRQEMLRRKYPVKCRKIIHLPFENFATGSGQRPVYSVLDSRKLQEVPGATLPDWKKGLQTFLDRWEKIEKQ